MKQIKMKITRYKKAGRYMSLYRNNFGFREPYQILLDGTFCQVALAHKVNIQDQVPKYLGGHCKLLTTACVIEETKRLGKPLHGAYLIVSQFPVHNCGHEQPISASKCLSSFIIDSRNKDHYLVATQDHQLRVKIAKLAVCPLIKLANNSLVMEKPTHKVQSKVSRTHHFLANKISDEEYQKVESLKREEKLIAADNKDEDVKIKKRKGPKGPNPLSCRKRTSKAQIDSSKKTNPNKSDDESRKRHRRKRKPIPRHVKKLLQEKECIVEPENKSSGT